MSYVGFGIDRNVDGPQTYPWGTPVMDKTIIATSGWVYMPYSMVNENIFDYH